MVLEVTRLKKGGQVEKRRSGKKWQKKGRKNFRALCAIFLLLIYISIYLYIYLKSNSLIVVSNK